jgi:hypothetical protein
MFLIHLIKLSCVAKICLFEEFINIRERLGIPYKSWDLKLRFHFREFIAKSKEIRLKFMPNNSKLLIDVPKDMFFYLISIEEFV